MSFIVQMLGILNNARENPVLDRARLGEWMAQANLSASESSYMPS